MDHDNWMEQDPTAPEGDALLAVRTQLTDSRYARDMAQAELMQAEGRRKKSTPELSCHDVELGLGGLTKATEYKRQGDLESALKLYELGIDLLLRCLKNANGMVDDFDCVSVEAKVSDALSEAETIKASLATKNRESRTGNFMTTATVSNRNTQTFLNNVSTGISSMWGTKKTGKPKTPTAVSKPNRLQVASQHQPTRRSARIAGQGNTKPSTPVASGTAKPLSPVTPPADTESRQLILSDFYVNPRDVHEICWSDIAGLLKPKQALQENAILPLIRPDLFTGLRKPQNILLWGPPGTGKTLMVKAVAHESRSSLFICTASALTSKWMGEGEKLVRTLFQISRELAPSIVFLDEMDALLSSRKSEGEHEASRRLKTEFMVQMDGFGNNDEPGMLLIACTNCPWDVDSAVLRRFPRRIYVPLPDSDARLAIIDHLLKSEKNSLSKSQRVTLAAQLRGFSGSDIKAIASEASFGPLRSTGGMDVIRNVRAKDIRPLNLEDFTKVLSDATKSITAEQLERFVQWQEDQTVS